MPGPSPETLSVTSRPAARFSVTRYARRMLASRHSRILRSQARISASVLPRKTPRCRWASRNVSWTRSEAPSLGLNFGPDHLVGDHQQILPATVEHPAGVVAQGPCRRKRCSRDHDARIVARRHLRKRNL